jgi:ClpP class serine protease
MANYVIMSLNKITTKRGDKLNPSKSAIQGDILTGAEAKDQGLIDEIGNMFDVIGKDFPGSKISALLKPDERAGWTEFASTLNAEYSSSQSFMTKVAAAIRDKAI